ncbi:hypothetical protein V474_02810 [Novosphingobium barchaimii LL02]|uniref:Aminoglycoside phosphotransferase domain-containing protein n=1 Tax=Novosphingobium barchaimii LL02 TaxID=1114963 RepID=A0A0J7XJW2_9SPHN|nr:phosphotransferase family protein [Novosphingobium barchaimii]KMS51997.1 hypothetical protein V474_02810 [Novosphingobium barchaimii LL02]
MIATRDIDALCAALRRDLADGSQITDLRPVTTGHSNETYVIEGLERVLRLPPVNTPLMTAHGIVTQARIYAELGAAADGPPVPRIFHVCDDTSVVGAPFFVMEQVAGDSVNDYRLPLWFKAVTAAARAQMCGEWIDAIGGLGRLASLRSLGLPVAPQDEARRWRKIGERVEFSGLVEQLDRLLSLPAACSGPASPVHGDCKLANMMFADGHLSAVLDWELGYNGEPLSDLGYLLYFFASATHGAALASREAGMFQRAQVIDAWERSSGRSAEGIAWYEALAVGKMTAILAEGYHNYATGQTEDERFAYFRLKRDENLTILTRIVDAMTDR